MFSGTPQSKPSRESSVCFIKPSLYRVPQDSIVCHTQKLQYKTTSRSTRSAHPSAPADTHIDWQELWINSPSEIGKTLVLFDGDTAERPQHEKSERGSEFSYCIQQQVWYSLEDCPSQQQREQPSKEDPSQSSLHLFVLHSVQVLHTLISAFHSSQTPRPCYLQLN